MRIPMAVSFVAAAWLLSGCTLWGWGANEGLELGVDTRGQTVAEPTPIGGTYWSEVDSRLDTSCGITTTQQLQCWGDNTFGQIGDGTFNNRRLPTPVGSAEWRQVSVGYYHVCGIQMDDSLWCWGLDDVGQLGNGADPASVTPVRVGSSTWRSVSASITTCGIQMDDSLWCWGSNSAGQIGDGSITDRSAPVRITQQPWRQVATGTNHTCGIQMDASLWCWGSNAYNTVLGDPSLGDSTLGDPQVSPLILPSPTPAPIGSARWTLLDAGEQVTCGIQTDQSLWCWGRNDLGEVGVGQIVDNIPTPTPVLVLDGRGWLDVSTANTHSCGIRADSTLWCWGYNTDQQLGGGFGEGQNLPTQVPAGSGWTTVENGATHSLAIRNPGSGD